MLVCHVDSFAKMTHIISDMKASFRYKKTYFLLNHSEWRIAWRLSAKIAYATLHSTQPHPLFMPGQIEAEVVEMT